MKTFAKILSLVFIVGVVWLATQVFDFRIAVPDPVVLEKDDLEQANKVLKSEISKQEVEFSQKKVSFAGTLDEIIALTNKAREKEGLSPLKRNEVLTESALLKTKDMRDNNYFEHVSPQGLDLSYFVHTAGYNYSAVGENLAEGYFSAEEIHQAWMDSEGHRKNILSAQFEEIGVAILEVEQEGLKSYLGVQHFGTAIDQKDLKVVTVCEKKEKKRCEDAQENREEVKDTIEKQEEIIKDAKKEGFSDKELMDLYENLEKLEDIKDELKDFLKECDSYISKCDKWK